MRKRSAGFIFFWRRFSRAGTIRECVAPHNKMNLTVAITNPASEKGGLCLHCVECDTWLSEYRLASERYTVLSGMIGTTDIPEAFRDPEFQKLNNEVAEAWLNCYRAREALSTHRETQVCRRSRPTQRQHYARPRMPAFELTHHAIVPDDFGAVDPIIGAVGANSMDDFWRGKLDDAKRRFSDEPNAETRAGFRRLLCLFADLVLRNQLPPGSE
jgi:hypothetical protein